MRVLSVILAAFLLASPPALAGYRSYGFAVSSDLNTGVATIMSAGSRAAAVRALRRVPSVGVVNLNYRVRDWSMGNSGLPDVGEFKIAASRNAAGIAKLRAALRANPVTRRALDDHGVPISRVVGVKIGSNGALRLYIL